MKEADVTRKRVQELSVELARVNAEYHLLLAQSQEHGIHPTELYTQLRVKGYQYQDLIEQVYRATSLQQVLESEKPELDLILSGVWERYENA